MTGERNSSVFPLYLLFIRSREKREKSTFYFSALRFPCSLLVKGKRKQDRFATGVVDFHQRMGALQVIRWLKSSFYLWNKGLET